MSTEADRLFAALFSQSVAEEATLNSAGATANKPDYGSALRAAFEGLSKTASPGTGLGARLAGASQFLRTEAEPLLGLFFLELGRACQAEETLTLEALKEGLRNTVTSLVRVGGARFGDGTLVDAFLPVSEAVHGAKDLGSALASAVLTAEATAARLSQSRAYPSSLVLRVITKAFAEVFAP